MGWLQQRASNIRYRVSGFPISVRYWQWPSGGSPAEQLRYIYARRYWTIRTGYEFVELAIGIVFLPLFVLGAALWHSFRIAAIHARRCGRPPLCQFFDQLRLFAASGVMPATYYIFSLQDDPTVRRARSFIKRAESKGSLYALAREKMPPRSSLNDKVAFEQRCVAGNLPVIPTCGTVSNGQFSPGFELPQCDLFIKPLAGKGGRGAERWIWLGDHQYRSGVGEVRTSTDLLEYLERLSLNGPLIIQPRILNDRSLAHLNCGALATTRVLTCLDECFAPEIIGAALRMASRADSVVDNLHSGGLTAAIDPLSGELGPATNLGKNARIGWVHEHPLTGGRITGQVLPWWPQVKSLALRGHRVFNDRLFVGWDIAMSDRGPIIVEGNSSPDLDILQRSARSGMMDGRFAELLAFHLVEEAAPCSRAA